jgi:hypothetical protein
MKLFWGFSIIMIVVQTHASPVSHKIYLELRKQALDRKRILIYNNDGGDAYLYPKRALPFSVEKFLKLRSIPLKNSNITTISYCTISSSFGQFTHHTEVGEFLTIQHTRKGKVNATPEFVKLKTDPLHEIVRFAHVNDLEVFWSDPTLYSHTGFRRLLQRSGN